jgi:hypothetical protein
MTARHLYIATPSHSGETVSEYDQSLIDTTALLARNGVHYTHGVIIGNALVHDARNQLVSWFLATDATDMLFIDADIGWQPEAALRLALSPHDVIGGAYPQKREGVETYNVAGLKPSSSGLVEVDYMGTGFLKIRRRAIEKLIKAHPDTRYQAADGREVYGLFQAPIADGKLTGEDAFFCRLWRASGGKVFLDPDMTLWHVGRKVWCGNFGELVRRANDAVAAQMEG